MQRAYHHGKLPPDSTLLSGHSPPDGVGFQSGELQIWYNNTSRHWSDPQPHAHQASDECFIVLDGTIIVDVDGHCVEIGAGEFCCFPKGVFHQVIRVVPPVVSLMIRAPSIDDKIFPSDENH